MSDFFKVIFFLPHVKLEQVVWGAFWCGRFYASAIRIFFSWTLSVKVATYVLLIINEPHCWCFGRASILSERIEPMLHFCSTEENIILFILWNYNWKRVDLNLLEYLEKEGDICKGFVEMSLHFSFIYSFCIVLLSQVSHLCSSSQTF